MMINTIGCFVCTRLMPQSAGGLAVAVFMQLSHGRLVRCDRCPAVTLLLLDVALKEIVEKRTDDGDCAEAPDGLPARELGELVAGSAMVTPHDAAKADVAPAAHFRAPAAVLQS